MPERETLISRWTKRIVLISALATGGATLSPRFQNPFGNAIDSLREDSPNNIRISPDRKNVAFVDHENLMVIDSNGVQKNLFTGDTGARLANLSWIDNGKIIMFTESYGRRLAITLRKIDMKN